VREMLRVLFATVVIARISVVGSSSFQCPDKWPKDACKEITDAIRTKSTILDLGSWNFFHDDYIPKTELPSSPWTELPALEILELETNNFTGRLPSSLCSMRKLQAANFGYNFFNGSLPECFFDGTILPDLFQLKLSTNMLTGTIPSSVGSLSNMITFSASINQMSGTIPSEIGRLPKLEHFDISSNRFHGTLPRDVTNHSSLMLLSVFKNDLSGTIPNAFGAQLESILLNKNRFTGTIPSSIATPSLISLNLCQNRLVGTIPRSLGFASSLSVLDLSSNALTGSVPLFRNLPEFGQLYLHYNHLTRVPTGAFDNSPINVVFLAWQNQNRTSAQLELEPEAFRGLHLPPTNKSRLALSDDFCDLVLTGNSIPTIPPRLFGNQSNVMISLSNLDVRTVSDHAFEGCTGVHINFLGNYVEKLSPRAFPDAAIMETECVDIEDWYVTSYAMSLNFGPVRFTCNNLTDAGGYDTGFSDCTSDTTYPNCIPRLVNAEGSAGLTALEACCKYGGGRRKGPGLLMEKLSPVRCEPYGGSVRCVCGRDLYRYEVATSSCIASCNFGHKWVEAAPHFHFVATQRYGACVPCGVGYVNDGTTGAWPTSCSECPQGRFASGNASTECTICGENLWSTSAAASACTSCAFGKSSSFGEPHCHACSPFFSLSAHCNAPYGGILMAVCLVVLVAISTFVVRHKWQKVRKVHTLAIDRQAMLLQASAEELSSLKSAWYVSLGDIEIQERIACGSFGEVYAGRFAGRWRVAVKKLLDSVDCDLSDDNEISFLMRVRHRRLVMFMGAGRFSDGNIFLVLEWMERGALDVYLRGESTISWRQRVTFLRDVCEGMRHLHSLRCLHRDLKSSNVLLAVENGDLRCKVGDFGLSIFARAQAHEVEDVVGEVTREATSSDSDVQDRLHKISVTSSLSLTLTCGAGTPTHLAPEIMRAMESGDGAAQRVNATQKVDVFAFGVLIWEVRERKVPWSELGETAFAHKIFRNVIQGARPKLSAADVRMPEGLDALMNRCWDDDPKVRPAFEDLLQSHFNKMRGVEDRRSRSSLDAATKRSSQFLEPLLDGAKE